MDYDNTLVNILQSISMIKNMPKKIRRLIYKTKRIEMLEDDGIKSIHHRFNMVCLFHNLKMKNKFDVNTEKIQIVKQIDGIDRYIIFLNPSGNKAIQNAIKFIKLNEDALKSITIPQTILTKCVLIDDNTEIDIKKIIMRYAVNPNNIELVLGHTIRNILDFNRINYTNNTIWNMCKIMNGEIIQTEINLNVILDYNILSVF